MTDFVLNQLQVKIQSNSAVCVMVNFIKLATSNDSCNEQSGFGFYGFGKVQVCICLHFQNNTKNKQIQRKIKNAIEN